MSMTTNKQTLRHKARLASADEWVKESGDGWEAICSSDDQANAGFVIAHFEGPDAKANREFVQAANPATVLALLDELESAERRNAELEARQPDLYLCRVTRNGEELYSPCGKDYSRGRGYIAAATDKGE
ncbi:ead/Ea22-like family protein [Lelliottia amnigena]|uniref:ead/Ea22-like family protein n=1 Tax=Lelliottia amnigena TaxID=61646 RepID=UPI00405662AF